MTVGYRIGTTKVGLAYVEALSLPLPRSEPVHYSQYMQLGNGQIRGGGWPVCSWRFDTITSAQIAILRNFCSGVSAPVYISTLGEFTWSDYSAVMIWPQLQTPKLDYNANFQIDFVKLVAA